MHVYIKGTLQSVSQPRLGHRGQDKRKIKEAFDKLKEQSLRGLANPLRNAPFGDTNGLGYWGLVWPELMHQGEEGRMKKGAQCAILAVQDEGKSKYLVWILCKQMAAI